MSFQEMTAVEAKIFVRDRANLFWGLSFPAALLVAIGFLLPGATEPTPDLGGARLVDVYAPITLALAVATLGLSVLPVNLATYRERGVLRRLSTTPVHPRSLLGAQLVVNLTTAVVAASLALVAGVVAFDLAVPRRPWWLIVVFVLAATSMFAVGLLIGSVAKTTSAGQGLGLAVYFPMLFFAGVWFPREVMPEGLRLVSDLTPMGAAVGGIGDAWAGLMPPVSSLFVMAAYTVAASLLGAWLFRWE